MAEKTLVILDPTLKRGFTAIPNAVLFAGGLSMAAKCLYFILLSFAWQENECFPGQQRLAEKAGCTDRTVRKYLDELKEYGLISWVQRGLNQTNVYYIHNLEDLEALSDKDRKERSGPDRKGCSGQERKELSDKEYSVKRSVVVVEETQEEIHDSIEDEIVAETDTAEADAPDDEYEQDMPVPVHSNDGSDADINELRKEIAQVTGGATISKSFAREVITGYPCPFIKTAIQDMSDQLARGMVFTSGVGAWLRTWLERNYEPDQKEIQVAKSERPLKLSKKVKSVSISSFGTLEQEKE